MCRQDGDGRGSRRRMPPLHWMGLALALLVVTVGVRAEPGEAEGGKTQQSREQLKEVQRELGRERAKAREAGRREAALGKELAKLEEDLKAKTDSLKRLERKLRGSSRRIAILSREIASTESRLEQSRILLKRRLRAIYKQGRYGYVRMLLSAEDLASAGRRLKYLSAVAAQDQRLMKTYSTTLADLSGKRGDLDRFKAEVADATQKAKSTRAQIQEERRKQRILLASVREEKAGHRAAIKELDKAAKDLQALIARLQREEERQRRASRAAPRREARHAEAPGPTGESPDLRGDGRFERWRGKLPWPAAGTLASTFGRQEHPRFHTVTFNRGIEIAAPLGRDILAVADGTVLYADWFKGYGRLIILDHGGGYFTLYAHAAEILVKVGEDVPAGGVIGKVGDSGSLEGSQLYFELRNRGKPEDPLVWLKPR